MTRKAPKASLQRAIELLIAGRLEEARRACRKLVQTRPDLAEAHLLLADIHEQAGDALRASDSLGRALRLRRDWNAARAQLMLGDLFGDAGRYAEAESRYRKALEIQPDLTDARYNLAAALHAAGRTGDSIAQLQALLEHEPAAADARDRLLRLLLETRRIDEMETVSRKGMAIHPEVPFYPQRLGIALWWRGRHDEALEAYRLAAQRAASPGDDVYCDAKLLEAGALLALGRYAEGWEAYRWRHHRERVRQAHPQLVEDPRQVSRLSQPKRIRILSEQGLGDELLFFRFAPFLRQRGHHLVAACGPQLAPLLATVPEVVDGIESAATQSRVDCVLASGDLPLASGQSFAPPLRLPVDPVRRTQFEARLREFGPPPYIGVTWRAGLLADDPKPARGSYMVKHVPPELLGAALGTLNARVVIVQRRPPLDELRQFSATLGGAVLDLSDVNDDLRNALAVLSLLDEYVGVSNTNMHLRASIAGKSARVLLRTPAEWRWGLEGSRSAWFPDFRLYRVAIGDDWRSSLTKVTEDLLREYSALQQK